MRYDKMTVKVQEAIQDATSIAHKHNHNSIDVVHMLYALLDQQDGVIPPLLDRLGVYRKGIEENIKNNLESKSRVYGSSSMSGSSPTTTSVGPP